MIGRTFGHYRILSTLGGGGMGVVYEAEDTNLERHVALKVLPDEMGNDPLMLERFKREAKAASALNNPHICTIHDIGEENGKPFIVMELMRGRTLKAEIGGAPLPVEAVVRLAVQIADGLEAAHGAGMVHRDVKPANIFITDHGEAKLLDFGLAKLAEASAEGGGDDPLREVTVAQSRQITIPGLTMGTIDYLSPEQAWGKEVDARGDIFSFGTVLYEMVTGTVPFRGDSAVGTIDAILHGQPVPASSLNPEVPGDLERIIAKATEKDPARRYQSATEIKADLRRLLRDAAPVAAAGRGPGRRGVWLAAGLGVGVLAVAGAFWMGHEVRGARAERAAVRVPEASSIAVLPFVDMSAGHDQQYFADGLAEELLDTLAQVPQLSVAARSSSFQFRGTGQDLRAIGEKLHVATVLEGSVRKDGRHVRISAQLVDVANGFDLWSESYDRELDDIFEVQDEIARAVSSALKVKLLGSSRPLEAGNGGDAEAYNLYLQGRYFSDRRDRRDLEQAVSYYENALKLRPDYALAWVGLADAHSNQANLGYIPADEGFATARREVEKALAIAPDLAEAYAALGWIRASYDLDWAGADAAYKKALALEPRNATVVRRAATLAGAMGRFDEAIDLDHRAIGLDPLSVTSENNLGLHQLYAGRLDDAERAFRRALDLSPGFPSAHMFLGRIWLRRSEPEAALKEMNAEKDPFWHLYGLALVNHALGRTEAASQALRDFIGRDAQDGAFQIAELYAYRGDADAAFEWLDRAYTQRDGGLGELVGDPLFAGLAHDPRYAAFLRKTGLP